MRIVFILQSAFSLLQSFEGSLHLIDAVGLDDVADLDVVVAGDLHAALEAFAHLADVLLEPLEGLQAGGAIRGRVDHDALANHAHLGVALDVALRDVAAGDGADAADLERVAHDGPAEVNDLFARLELAFQGGANV